MGKLNIYLLAGLGFMKYLHLHMQPKEQNIFFSFAIFYFTVLAFVLITCGFCSEVTLNLKELLETMLLAPSETLATE